MNIIKKIDTNDKSLFSNMNFDKSYYYWCDKLELQKLVSFEDKDKQRFIPCYPYGNDISYVDLIGKSLLIFLKNPKIFYGFLTIESILIKKRKEKYYFVKEKFIKDDEIVLLE